MMRFFFLLLTLSPLLTAAQYSKAQPRKYPSLLWEITGNGLKKPSYLFGTMHVSSKMAFNLSDSFYLAIRRADVVALETNPESWQEDMSKYEIGSIYSNTNSLSNSLSWPGDYFTINTLKFYKYDKKIERSLYSNPSAINNLLYRSYGNDASDFEEDTYLDMYIYQCGKRWGKKVTGVEQYGESMKLMQEAYRDAAKDRNKKERSYDMDEDYSIAKLQEAYRKGNLDQLDSINKLNSFSAAFDEKFMYKRNEIQAHSIDSILKTNFSLFVGVGAAHLPGSRGVIEMLRDKGYNLRPVMMGERDSRQKELVEKIRVPVTFRTELAEDGFFKVDIPGKFYQFGDEGALAQWQYADMANGSYYMVTRIMTNGWLWGHREDDIYKRVDSLLYENIPGKIISKSRISRNGYPGLDVINKTRRGDIQRYHIFITPFEVLVFKMSGNGDYVRNGVEASRFFGSIQLKEYKQTETNTRWKNYSPPYGGFSVDLPHDPYIGNDGSWIFDAEDKSAELYCRVIRSDIHNYNFVEEDTFDLGLMAESFAASEFIDTLLERRHMLHKGYPALECRFRAKHGALFLTRFIIQGPHYYTLLVGGPRESLAMQNFLNSFEIKPYSYPVAKERKDTILYFSVKSPVFPEQKKEQLTIPSDNYIGSNEDEDEDESEEARLERGVFRSKIISNDSTGEKIYVSFYKTSRYFYLKDSSHLEREMDYLPGTDSNWIVRSKKKYKWPDKTKVWEMVLSDTGSSRCLIGKYFYKDGIFFSLLTQSDTLSRPSRFVQSFFDSFKPADTLKGTDPLQKKSSLFFADFMSPDSVLYNRAVKNISTIYLDSSDLPQLKHALQWLTWDKKKYLDIKKTLISKLDAIKTETSAELLKTIYYAAADTVELQYAALEALLQQKTSYAYAVFREIISSEPPVIEASVNEATTIYPPLSALRSVQYKDIDYHFDNNIFFDELYDSLLLTKAILPDLLPLLNLDDYKRPVMQLLGALVDSNLARPRDYDSYFSKFLIEAKQQLKKQAIAEKRRAIKKAEDDKTDQKSMGHSYWEDNEQDDGNEDLGLYATLLLPFWETHPAVQPVIRQMLTSEDKRLKYNTLLLMIRNNKPFHDSLLHYFAGLDEFRYELYLDLKAIRKGHLFPSRYNTHLDLGKSALLLGENYNKPDTIQFIEKLPAEARGKKGLVYFYKYKTKKDDINWKLAMVGLVPEDPGQFEFEESSHKAKPMNLSAWLWGSDPAEEINFTGFLDTKIREEEPLAGQLQKELRKKLYSLRKSAKEFYEESSNGRYDTFSRMDFGD